MTEAELRAAAQAALNGISQHVDVHGDDAAVQLGLVLQHLLAGYILTLFETEDAAIAATDVFMSGVKAHIRLNAGVDNNAIRH